MASQVHMCEGSAAPPRTAPSSPLIVRPEIWRPSVALQAFISHRRARNDKTSKISRVTMTYNVFNLTNAQVRRYISSRDVLSTLAYHLAQKSLTAASLYRLDFFSSNPRFSNTIEPNTINLRRQEKWLACRIGRVDELKMPALTVELCGVTS